uniref:OSJNBa0032N05.25 protein n=1 Tax=Oryza sativa subsp. japonica TaxID=39947 RepID=Q5CAH4_ORYSJ|nr:OSJNBa0032N05.25 [Oryza sativa Japonica Group]
MSEEEVNAKIMVTVENLTEEQQQMVHFVANLQMRCLQCFIMIPEGPIQKTRFPKPIVEILQDTVDEAVHRGLLDQVPLPHRYKVPDFSKFSGQDDTPTMEHISRLLAQCGEASAEEALKVRFFPLSLTASAFTWFSSLPSDSIQGWTDLEKQFHDYFFAGIKELKLSDLISVEQQEGESAIEYIKRFRNVRGRCYSLSLSDEQLADLAFQGLSSPIRERFFCHEFDCLAHLMQTASAHES